MFKQGDKVTYVDGAKREKGIVKAQGPNKDSVFVVYNWGDDHTTFMDKTASLTKVSKLEEGW